MQHRVARKVATLSPWIGRRFYCCASKRRSRRSDNSARSDSKLTPNTPTFHCPPTFHFPPSPTFPLLPFLRTFLYLFRKLNNFCCKFLFLLALHLPFSLSFHPFLLPSLSASLPFPLLRLTFYFCYFAT